VYFKKVVDTVSFVCIFAALVVVLVPDGTIGAIKFVAALTLSTGPAWTTHSCLKYKELLLI
jgi:hypothetical protein